MPTKIDVADLPVIYANWRTRWSERDDRIAEIDLVVSGDYEVYDPDERTVENRSPNLIQVALEDTAEAASLVPTVRITPNKPTKSSRQTAAGMEKIATTYLEVSRIELLIPESILDAGATGFYAWTVLPDQEQRYPVIEKRDPRHCYPEPGWRVGERVRRAILARNVYATQMPTEWQTKLTEAGVDLADPESNVIVTLVEYFDDYEYILAAIYESSQGVYGASATTARTTSYSIPVELDRWHHELDFCPVVIGQRLTLDGEPRGQFDQVIGPQKAHVELWGMVMDYADQAVYSDIWVRDLIGDMPYGGGSFIELGPNGGIGRIPPAVTGLNVIDNLERLTEAIHVGGRWPKSRPGQIDQAIASGKFLEASAGMMNTAIRTYHMILARSLEQALRMCFAIDVKFFPGEKTAAGTLRSQEFLEEYHTDNIDLDHRVKVDYGLGFGREPSQSAVLAIQYSANDLISDETVQENIEGLSDLSGERAKIDVETFRKMAQAKILEGVQAGTIPERALIEMARQRANGDDLFDLYEKYIVEPQEEAMAGMLQSNLGGGGLLPPGATPDQLGTPTAPGIGPPGAPTPAVPPAPAPAELLARINAPAGPGGTIGTQVQG